MPRPRSEATTRAIREAALALASERGVDGFSVDELAAEAGASKATIYRWWKSKPAVVLDALVELTDVELPFPDSGDVQADLRNQMRRVAKLFKSPTGGVIRGLVGAAQDDPELADAFREQFVSHRRKQAVAAISRGVELGQIRKGVDAESAVDALYAPLWMRLVLGQGSLTPRAVDKLLDAVWPGLAA